ALARATMGSVLEAYDARAGLKWSQQLSDVVDRMAVTADGTMLAGVAYDSACTSSCLEKYSLWSAVDGTLMAQQSLPPGVGPYGGAYGGVGNNALTFSATHNVCPIQLGSSSGPPYSYRVRIYRTDG